MLTLHSMTVSFLEKSFAKLQGLPPEGRVSSGEPIHSPGDTLAWVLMNALPDVQGDSLPLEGVKVQSLLEMKRWCEVHADCVGFATQPGTTMFFPKKTDTGFDVRTANWTRR